MIGRRAAAAPLLALALLAGCGRRDDAAPRATDRYDAASGERVPDGALAASGADSAAAGAPAPGGAPPRCTYTGRWDPCTIAERLDRSGLAPQPDSGRPPHTTLGAPAAAWTVGNARLLVFIYPDVRAREAAQRGLRPGQYLTPGEEIGVNALPTLIVSENLLALLDSRNEHQRERVADAITAGPPQAGR